MRAIELPKHAHPLQTRGLREPCNAWWRSVCRSSNVFFTKHCVITTCHSNGWFFPMMHVDQRQALRHQALHDCRNLRICIDDGRASEAINAPGLINAAAISTAQASRRRLRVNLTCGGGVEAGRRSRHETRGGGAIRGNNQRTWVSARQNRSRLTHNPRLRSGWRTGSSRLSLHGAKFFAGEEGITNPCH